MRNAPAVKFIQNISLGVLTVLLFLFPLFFLTNTTEAFILPKQILLVVGTSALLVLWSAGIIAEHKLIIRTSPLNIPVAIFGIIILASSLLSRNLYDSLALSIPVFASIVLYFIIINTVTSKKGFLITFGGFLAGAVGSGIITILYNFNIFFLPIAAIENKYFTTIGSPVQSLLYVVPIFAIIALSLFSEVRGRKMKFGNENVAFGIAGVILLTTVIVFAYQLITATQKPLILPFTYGFQIATAAISQDSSRFLIALPFGSGYGTFLPDFTRYKFADINLNPTLWSTSFSASSSFVLELLATTGILGLLSYLFIIGKLLKTRAKGAAPIYYGTLLLVIGSSFLPFTLVTTTLIFVLLAFYIAYLSMINDRRVYDVSISLVALRHGLLSFEDVPEHNRPRRDTSILFPILLSIIIVIVSGFISFQAIRLYSADTKIASSLSQANRNNGQMVYNLQLAALQEFPYRADYYRIFSQINLALANSIVSSIPQGQTPSEQTRKTISDLLQQAVNNGRAAVALAPTTAINWENLSQIYRNLIGVGEGAPEFTVLTLNQAIALDPANPLLRIELGGVYYQLQQYDAAINQFNQAIELKPDLANAYYNRGHAYESKGDLQLALQDYETAASLLTSSTDKKQLQGEIDALKKKIGSVPQGTNQQATTGASGNQTPLEVNTPAAPIPSTAPQVKLSPPPAAAVETSPTPTPEE